jgi:hypothetical protein
LSDRALAAYDTKVKDRQHQLLQIARDVFELVEHEDSKPHLHDLAALTLALKPLLDELPDYPDLGQDLHEYALLKSEGEEISERELLSVKEMLGL